MKHSKAGSAAGPSGICIEDLPEEYQAFAHLVGMEKALFVAKHMGGSSLYIPKADRIVRGAKQRALRKEFNGHNHRALSKKYGYSVTWIRKIVAQPN